VAGDAALLVLGLALLIGGADVMVRGAVGLSLRFRVPALVVSLTVVAAGTSAPELVISARAVADGLPGLALGNVIGSNIANVLLVIGLPALIAGFAEPDGDSRRSYAWMLGATALFTAFMVHGRVPAWGAALLLTLLVAMLTDAIWRALARRTGPETEAAAAPAEAGGAKAGMSAADPAAPAWRHGLMIGLGVAGLAIGADLLVAAAARIAAGLGVGPAVIGLSIVAIGTSLPELATAAAAGLRGRGDVALGNVIGSNIFNLLGITGVAALVGPLWVPDRIAATDLWVLWAATLALAPLALFGRPFGRRAGLVLTGCYILYLVALGG